jgi:hypothetical protein
MIAEAIDRILRLAAPNTLERDGVLWSDKPFQPIKPLIPPMVQVETLDGFVDLIEAPIDNVKVEDYLIHVVSPWEVALRKRVGDQGQRIVPVTAKYDAKLPFQFGQFLLPETFVIGLQAGFVESDDLKYVLEIVSSLRDEKVVISNDDGVSQQVHTRAGISLKETATVKRVVNLAPRRTFTEVVQPTSRFILRLRSGREGELPSCTLFEADGGAWQREAVNSVAAYLSGKTTGNWTIVS